MVDGGVNASDTHAGMTGQKTMRSPIAERNIHAGVYGVWVDLNRGGSAGSQAGGEAGRVLLLTPAVRSAPSGSEHRLRILIGTHAECMHAFTQLTFP